MRLMTAIGLLALTGLLSGCGKKLDVDSKFKISGESKMFELEPINQAQKIKITGTSTGAPVNVFVYLDENKGPARNQILSKKPGDAILAKQEKVETINLDAEIPANKAAVVHVSDSGGEANVHL